MSELSLRPFLTASLVALLLSHAAHGQISVCGLIPGGTVWTRSDSPVTVTCDLQIADLVVDPGVEIRVAGNFRIDVLGRVRCLGTAAAPIHIRGISPTGWRGFLFQNALSGSAFRWCQIEGATESAVHLVDSYPSFAHVRFIANSAPAFGGGIRADIGTADLVLDNCHFEDCYAETAGGAIHCITPTGSGAPVLRLTECVFRSNAAGTTSSTHDTFGGAVYCDGNAAVARSAFVGCRSHAYTIFAYGGRYTRGGAYYGARGQHDIIATSFLANGCVMDAHGYTPDASRAYGGAVFQDSGTLLLANCLLANNLLSTVRWPDQRGGAFYAAGGNATVLNCTVVDNSEHGVFRDGGLVALRNSVFYNSNNGLPASPLGANLTASYCNVQTNGSGVTVMSFNPILDSRHRPLTPSPAIDGGDPAPALNDVMPPGQGTLRNDMGYTGGPLAIASGIADFTTFGTGCAGTAGVPTLSALGNVPVISTAFDVALRNLPPAAFHTPFGVLGLSRTAWGTTPLPASLSLVGLTGCSLHVSPDVFVALVNRGGSATWRLVVPNDARLIGLILYLQAGVADPGANPAGVVVTNAGAATLGLE